MKAIGEGEEGGVVEAGIIPGDGEVVMIDEVVLMTILEEYLNIFPWQSQADGDEMRRDTETESRSTSPAFGKPNS